MSYVSDTVGRSAGWNGAAQKHAPTVADDFLMVVVKGTGDRDPELSQHETQGGAQAHGRNPPHLGRRRPLVVDVLQNLSRQFQILTTILTANKKSNLSAILFDPLFRLWYFVHWSFAK